MKLFKKKKEENSNESPALINLREENRKRIKAENQTLVKLDVELGYLDLKTIFSDYHVRVKRGEGVWRSEKAFVKQIFLQLDTEKQADILDSYWEIRKIIND